MDLLLFQYLSQTQDTSGLNLYTLDAVTGHLLHQSQGLAETPENRTGI